MSAAINLVLLPGLNNTQEIWQPLLAHLPSEVNAYALQCPTVDDVDAIADSLLAELPAQFYLCGFSFGGYVALSILHRYPQRVQGLILAGTSAKADSPQQVEFRRSLIARLQTEDYQQMINQQASKAFHADSLLKPELMRIRRSMINNYGAERFVAHLQACIARPDREQVLTDMTIPLLVISAVEDQVMSMDSQLAMAKLAKDAELAIIQHSGHLMPLEQPEQFAAALMNWLTNYIGHDPK
ncbi:alpha/beta fold hydrolase [Rheinheimera salexigens]|uniref:AB hydrolase-1 domain-containing protein n=1 Tax=Rheinheimera salexigens TaxID=1628148 RepID=A0A1E7Q3K7_9GAMM|nr:alpha/beta hydrolase [Rheinheimera salexigens]OEY68653.1 hypothetical protein BI198_02990 [Rheinheimera salexigens]